MSARLLVLPVVFGSAALSAAVDVSARKGPHCLRLVQACAVDVPVPVPDVPVSNAQQRGVRTADASLAFYRKYTEGMLRRYVKLSMESGRVPSLLGQEMFRGRVTSYKVRSFEDVVIFVHDMDRCFKELTPGQMHLVRRIGITGHTQGEAAALLGLSLRTVVRRYGEALDKLTRVLLELKMMEPLAECRE